MDVKDLLISEFDLTPLPGGEPELTRTPLDTIAQDVKHLVLESGIVVRMVGERSYSRIELFMQRLALKIEDSDFNIIPGTVETQWLDNKYPCAILLISANTKFGLMRVEVSRDDVYKAHSCVEPVAVVDMEVLAGDMQVHGYRRTFTAQPVWVDAYPNTTAGNAHQYNRSFDASAALDNLGLVVLRNGAFNRTHQASAAQSSSGNVVLNNAGFNRPHQASAATPSSGNVVLDNAQFNRSHSASAAAASVGNSVLNNFNFNRSFTASAAA